MDVEQADGLDQMRARLGECLRTREEFSSELLTLLDFPACPLEALTFEWIRLGHEESTTVGQAGSGPVALEQRLGNVTMRLWAKAEFLEIVDVNELAKQARACFDEFHREPLRSPVSGLVDYQNHGRIQELAEAAFDHHRASQRDVAVLFCDLDGFKAVNDTISMAQGDIVIQRTAGLLERITDGSGLVLHGGGDEFILVLPGANEGEAAEIALTILDESTRYDFRSEGQRIGISIGAACHSSTAPCRSLRELIGKAESALKREVKAKTKSTVRFQEDQILRLGFGADALLAAFCNIKASLGAREVRTFANTWLNLLASRVSHQLTTAPIEVLQRAVDDFVDLLKPTYDSSVFEAQLFFGSCSATSAAMSPTDIAFAVAAGVFHAAGRNRDLRSAMSSLTLRQSETGVALADRGAEIWSMPASCDALEFEFGAPWGIADPALDDQKAGRLAILARIGHREIGIPEGLVAASIVIDDRPTSEGGLPDFWELTLSRILDALDEYPNVVKVFVCGDQHLAARSVQMLTKVDEWNTQQMEYKTTLDEDTIKRGRERLRDNVHCIRTGSEMLDALSRETLGPRAIVSADRRTRSNARRSLARTIETSGTSLRPSDGCRVRTIDEAFAVVLELLRQSGHDDDEDVRDQAGEELRELTDFKVELTEPTVDMIPTFYEQEEEALKSYYEHEFVDKDGIFARRLAINDQLERMTQHLVGVLSSEFAYATRRAILVVPNALGEQDRWTPLGLVSVRCIPRFQPSRIVLHFSFNWRTVEALVGFPYSLYGSVRFSEQILRDVKKRLHGNQVRRVELGHVTYIAQSLHMFRDPHALEIARRIVNDASQ